MHNARQVLHTRVPSRHLDLINLCILLTAYSEGIACAPVLALQLNLERIHGPYCTFEWQIRSCWQKESECYRT